MAYGAGSAASGLGRTVIRNPKPTFYASVFIVAFSFVAANALWYQPQDGHLSPFLATRDPHDPNAIAGYRPMRPADPADVTTFKIERAPSSAQQTRQSQQAQNGPIQNGQSQNGQTQNGQPQDQLASGEPRQNQPYTGLPAPGAAAKPSTTPSVDDVRAIIAGQSAGSQSGTDQSATGTDPMLVSSIQRALAGRGLYDGAADGLMGPRTQSAILFYEEASGLPQRGLATPELLAALQSQSRATAGTQMNSAANSGALPMPVPRQAPRQEMPRAIPVSVKPSSPVTAQPAIQQAPTLKQAKAPVRNEDPITAAIHAAERQPAIAPPAAIPRSGIAGSNASGGATRVAALPASARRTDGAMPGTMPSTMVLQIQKGLSNIAYTDVELDGVAGTQTKAAIRRFQKHYRLPETGEPDQLVLAKLKAIGAL